MADFNELRKKYKTFIYDGYHINEYEGYIELKFDFRIEDLCEFHPVTKIITTNLNVINPPAGGMGKKLIFALGMAEAVSYWKCACPQNFVVNCGKVDEGAARWWKTLWFNGLSELFYRNAIKTDIDSFVNISSDCDEIIQVGNVKSSGLSIVPIGGGKDSDVTLDLLSDIHDKVMGFTVNDQGARTEAAEVSGIGKDKIIRTLRTIDPELLKRNAEGFINGHTPFSSVVAFLSAYCAYLTGSENIILSNEASANESNIEGTQINHQYSKSYQFESDFNFYMKNYIDFDVKYFSLLRPFNELQIAAQFSQLEKYHKVFKSCNAGSKKNIWCCNCAKCLFVYIILSPFLSEEKLVDIFGCNMLEKFELVNDFEGLTGLSGVKPFECIGTVDEVRTALNMTVLRYIKEDKNLPALLEHYIERTDDTTVDTGLFRYFNKENNIPEEFIKYAERMYENVSSVE
ncbi:MAG: hypothetical protein K5756_04010 [Clostridiales bacterium]|nr:hypothetical protein [Clostridiales bacterium]